MSYRDGNIPRYQAEPEVNFEDYKEEAPSTQPEPVVVQPSYAAAIALAAEAAPVAPPPPPVNPGLMIHIDGDFLAYATAGNNEALPGDARLNCLAKIESLRAAAGADSVVVHVGQPGSQKGERYLVAQVKPYQAQRKSSAKPKNQPYLADYLLNFVGATFLSKPWLTREADDGIASVCHYAIGQTPNYGCIATKDKDMRMIPGYHIDWDTYEVTIVPPGAYSVIGPKGKQFGLKWFWLQMLLGDTADNIPGLEYYENDKGTLARLGPKTAEKLLAPYTTSDQAAAAVIALYQGGYQDTWADRFVEQAALLWMRCGVEAPIDDFLTHAGWSKISTPFPAEITAATARMVTRVTAARAALDAL